MKIIGRTGDRYLVTATEQELARIAGFSYANTDFRNAMTKIGAFRPNGYGSDGKLVENVEIPVSDLFDRIAALRNREEEVKRASSSLRALADLMDGKLPSVVAPEPPPEPFPPTLSPAAAAAAQGA